MVRANSNQNKSRRELVEEAKRILQRAKLLIEVTRELGPFAEETVRPLDGLRDYPASLGLRADRLAKPKTLRVLVSYLSSFDYATMKSNGWWVWIFFERKGGRVTDVREDKASTVKAN